MQSWFCRMLIRKILNELMVSFNLVFTICYDVFYFLCKEKTEWILIKSYFLFCARKCGQKSCCSKALNIDNLVIFCFPDAFQHPQKIAEFIFLLIPHQRFM